MALLTLADVREHIETDLVDPALQRIMDSEEAEIDVRFGAVGVETDDLEGGERELFPSRPILTVTSLDETIIDSNGSEVTTTLDPTDFKILNDGRVLLRQIDGVNPENVWGERIKLIYTPKDTTLRRVGVFIDLIKLALANNGLKVEWSGDYRAEQKFDYQDEREKILNRLNAGRRLMA